MMHCSFSIIRHWSINSPKATEQLTSFLPPIMSTTTCPQCTCEYNSLTTLPPFLSLSLSLSLPRERNGKRLNHSGRLVNYLFLPFLFLSFTSIFFLLGSLSCYNKLELTCKVGFVCIETLALFFDTETWLSYVQSCVCWMRWREGPRNPCQRVTGSKVVDTDGVTFSGHCGEMFSILLYLRTSRRLLHMIDVIISFAKIVLI